MTAFQVYLVMQLDSASAAFFIAAIVSGLISLVTVVLAGIGVADEDCPWHENTAGVKAFARTMAIVFAVFFVLAAATPSTKTACAMIAVPKIVNNEKLQGDMSDVYELGMQRIKDELTKEKK